MALMPSTLPVVLNAQQEPHCSQEELVVLLVQLVICLELELMDHCSAYLCLILHISDCTLLSPVNVLLQG